MPLCGLSGWNSSSPIFGQLVVPLFNNYRAHLSSAIQRWLKGNLLFFNRRPWTETIFNQSLVQSLGSTTEVGSGLLQMADSTRRLPSGVTGETGAGGTRRNV